DARDENFDNKELNRNPDYLAGALAGDKEALAEAARNKGGDNTVAEQAKSTCRFPCLLPEQQQRLDKNRAARQAEVDKALGPTQPAATTQQPPVTPVALTPQEQVRAAQDNTGLRNNGIVKNDKGEFGWWGMSRKSGQLEFVPIEHLRDGVPIGFHPDNRGSGFGDCNGRATCHQGVDWTNDHDNGSYQPLYSRVKGRITALGVGSGRTGNRIWIEAEHGGTDKIEIGSFHMSQFAGRKVGDPVTIGEYIGDSGKTSSRANDDFIAHLHDECRVNGIPVECNRVTRYLYPSREALIAQVQNIPVQSASAWQPPVGSVYDTTAYLPRSDVIATGYVGSGGGRQYPAGRMSLGMGGGATNYGGNYAGQNFGPYGNGSGNANNGGLMGLLSGLFSGGQPQDGQQGGIPGSTVGYPPTNPSPTNPSTDLTAAVTPLTN
ncbi:MAG: hypothetical protein EBS53_17590, partial [Bacteroidetes bacterium]|nr:hypothetical protein [Bacteroidota bacterium]